MKRFTTIEGDGTVRSAVECFFSTALLTSIGTISPDRFSLTCVALCSQDKIVPFAFEMRETERRTEIGELIVLRAAPKFEQMSFDAVPTEAPTRIDLLFSPGGLDFCSGVQISFQTFAITIAPAAMPYSAYLKVGGKEHLSPEYDIESYHRDRIL